MWLINVSFLQLPVSRGSVPAILGRVVQSWVKITQGLGGTVRDLNSDLNAQKAFQF